MVFLIRLKEIKSIVLNERRKLSIGQLNCPLISLSDGCCINYIPNHPFDLRKKVDEENKISITSHRDFTIRFVTYCESTLTATSIMFLVRVSVL